jgi:hypothetical protein
MRRPLLTPAARALLLTLMLLAPLAASADAQRRRRRPAAQPDPNGCALGFAGSDRAAVKNRGPRLDVTFHNGGHAVSVADWYALVCPFDPEVPSRRADIPKTRPLPQERLKVKVRAFLLAVKAEPDNDLHVQVGDTTRFNQEQLVVEVPPGGDFCDARTEIMSLMREDGAASLRRHIFRRPPHVEITGYVFLDSSHMTARRSDFCTQDGGRGIRGALRSSPVRGIWEIHPVTKVERVSR